MIDVINGDCFEVLNSFEDGHFDHCITDCPYGIDFDKKHKWDQNLNYEFHRDWASAVYRTLKPGSFLISFAAANTMHTIARGIEAAGFQIKDQIIWQYNTGFAKNNRVDDKFEKAGDTVLAEKWKGWGMILKPAFEPILIAQKPFKGPLYRNVELNNVGAFHIDALRDPETSFFPSNVWPHKKPSVFERNAGCEDFVPRNDRRINATRPNGDADQYKTEHKNPHPTLKPRGLMQRLIALVGAEGNKILDPFCGSGTTLIAAQDLGFDATGIELDQRYCDIANARISYWAELASSK